MRQRLGLLELLERALVVQRLKERGRRLDVALHVGLALSRPEREGGGDQPGCGAHGRRSLVERYAAASVKAEERAFTPDAFTGQRLGAYELVAKLATGGMSELFLALRRGEAGFSKLVVLKRV